MCKERLVFAHRGASLASFENTMQAFERARVDGADGLEIDVQLSKDHVPIVIHDRELRRLARRERLVDTLNIRSVKKVKLGAHWWERRFGSFKIPALVEVVHFCELHGLALNVELKETVSEHPEQVGNIIRLLEPLEDVHISSFDRTILEEVRACDPSIEIAQLLVKKQLNRQTLQSMTHADVFHLNAVHWTSKRIALFESIGKPVRLYNVFGDEPIVERPHPLIIGWITDTPERFQ